MKSLVKPDISFLVTNDKVPVRQLAWTIPIDLRSKFRHHKNLHILRYKSLRDFILPCVSYLKERSGDFRRKIISFVVSRSLRGETITFGSYLVARDAVAADNAKKNMSKVGKNNFQYGFADVSDKLRSKVMANSVLAYLFRNPMVVDPQSLDLGVVVPAVPTSFNKSVERKLQFERVVAEARDLSKLLLLGGDIESNPGPKDKFGRKNNGGKYTRSVPRTCKVPFFWGYFLFDVKEW